MSVEQKLEDVFIQLNEIQKINAERYESLKNENKELKEQNIGIINQINELKSQNDELKKQNIELKNQIGEILNINSSINEQFKIMNIKNDEIKTKIVSELINDNKNTLQTLDNKIKFIYNYIETEKNNEIVEINKKNEEKQNDLNLIKKWINESLDTKQNIDFQLIYKKSRDGSTISDFHWKCDNKGKTVMIITTNEGLKFGGYKNDSWNKDG